MSEETTTTTAAPAPAATTTTTAAPPAPATKQQQMQLGMSADQVTAHTDAVRRAAEAEAKLKAAHDANTAEAGAKEREAKAAEAAKSGARLSELEQSNAALVQQVRRSKALEVLPGIKDAATFLPLVDELVQLDDGHALTDDSRAALAAWAKDRPYLFEDASAGGTGTTPMAGAGHNPAEGSFTAEETATFQQLGVVPGAYKNTEAYKKIGWIFGHDSRKAN